MSAETRQLLEMLLGLTPWVIFLIALVWSAVHSMRREAARTTPSDRIVDEHPTPRETASGGTEAGLTPLAGGEQR